MIQGKCYWHETGFHQAKLHKLHKLIPSAGPIIKSKDNPCLEKLRKAINCYYDLYNNDLRNAAQSFAQIFGFRSTDYRYDDGIRYFSPKFYILVEDRMDELVMSAWLEQLNKGVV